MTTTTTYSVKAPKGRGHGRWKNDLGTLTFEDNGLAASVTHPDPEGRHGGAWCMDLVPGSTPEDVAAQFPDYTLTLVDETGSSVGGEA